MSKTTSGLEEFLTPILLQSGCCMTVFYINPGVVVDNNGYAAYNIQDWVRTYLKEHPQTLSGISIVPAAGEI